jgi:hypothetical protein
LNQANALSAVDSQMRHADDQPTIGIVQCMVRGEQP